MQKNIIYTTGYNAVYSDRAFGNNVHLDDISYITADGDRHSVLFLHVEKGNSGYEAMLSVKSDTDAPIDLFRKKLPIAVSENLFEQVDEFQRLRRGMEIDLSTGSFENQSPENWDAVLTEAIYQTFFAGRINAVCHDFLGLLQSNKIQELLLVISTDDDRIQNLPWEMVKPKLTTDAGYDLPNGNFGLIRTREKNYYRFYREEPATEAAPLKLLFIPALPENGPEKNRWLEVEEQQRKIIEAVRSLEIPDDQPPKLIMEMLDCANLDEIKEALSTRNHDIVHISGYGSYIEEVKDGILYLEDEDGDERQVSARKLGNALKGFSSIKLLVLSGCETAGSGSQMAAVGFPAVLAMRFSISDSGTGRFTETLYRKLANGDTLTRAMSVARQEFRTLGSQKPGDTPSVAAPAEWFTPILYQNRAMGALVKKGPYDADVLKQFYPQRFIRNGIQTGLTDDGWIGRRRLLLQLQQTFKLGNSVYVHGLAGLGKTTTVEAFAELYRRRYGYAVLIFRGEPELQGPFIGEKIFQHWKNRVKPDDDFAVKLKNQLDNGISGKGPTLLTNNCLYGHNVILIFELPGFVEPDNSLIDWIFLSNLLIHVPPTCRFLLTSNYEMPNFLGSSPRLAVDKMSHTEQYRYITFSETLRQLPQREREIIDRRIDGNPRELALLEGLLKKDPTFTVLNLDSQTHSENWLLESLVDRLTEAERAVFTTASIFVSRTSIAVLGKMMEKSADELTPILTSLRDWSLCFWDEIAQTFEVHELTRVWMRERQQPDGVRFKALSKQVGDYFQAQPTHEDHCLANSYFEQAEAWEEFVDNSFQLEEYYRSLHLHDDGLNIVQKVLEKDISLQFNLECLDKLGTIRMITKDARPAIKYWEPCLTLLREIGDKRGEAYMLSKLANAYNDPHLQDPDRALAYWKQSLSTMREIGDKKGECDLLNTIARWERSDPESRIRNIEESLKIARQLSDKAAEARALNHLAIFTEDVQALAYLEQSVSIWRELGKKRGDDYTMEEFRFKIEEINTLRESSYIYWLGGNIGVDFDKVMAYMKESLNVCHEINYTYYEKELLEHMGQMSYQYIKDVEKAIVYYYRCFIVSNKSRYSHGGNARSELNSICSEIGSEKFDQIIRTFETKEFIRLPFFDQRDDVRS